MAAACDDRQRPAGDPPGAGRGLAFFVATGGYCGLAPKAPGTVASLVAALFGAAALRVSPALVLMLALLALAAGLWAIPKVAAAHQDPAEVVIDEWAGMWLAMAALVRPGLLGVGAAFLLFRLFDVAKPGPIGWADRRHGAVWVMADDLLAGAAAALILIGARLLGGWR